jgi:8-oxo-dGTP pyrophosphatase MutT (NUDIX family)
VDNLPGAAARTHWGAMAKRKVRRAVQFGALPWRIGRRGTREVMLLTSRETRRWVIPKGWPIKGRKPREVVSQEAYEEAGLTGYIVSKRPLGNYHYEKRLAKRAILCEVRVFLFRVDEQLDDWPEKSARETRWFDAAEAAALIEEGGLAEIIVRFAGSYVRFVAYAKPYSPAPLPAAFRLLSD